MLECTLLQGGELRGMEFHLSVESPLAHKGVLVLSLPALPCLVWVLLGAGFLLWAWLQGGQCIRGQQRPSPWQQGRGPDKACSTSLLLEATCILDQREWTVWHVKCPRGQAPPPRKPASSPQATVLTSPTPRLEQIWNLTFKMQERPASWAQGI